MNADVPLLVAGVVVALLVLAVMRYVARRQRSGSAGGRTGVVVIAVLTALIIAGSLAWSAVDRGS